ncbi:MAG: hypothetical protein ACK5OW_00830 [bacterium]|jgi:hypothetical protein
MSNNEHTSKVFVLLEAIKQSKARYIEIKSKEGLSIYKMKLLLEDKDLVELLDGFFDEGFIVKEISKKEFDDFEGVETLNFNL